MEVESVMLLMTRKFDVLRPMNRTRWPPEQPAQAATATAPERVLPLASASYLVVVTALFTTKVTVVLWLWLPLVPVIVSVYLAGAVALVVEQLTVHDPAPPLMESAVQVAPLGSPPVSRLTVPR